MIIKEGLKLKMTVKSTSSFEILSFTGDKIIKSLYIPKKPLLVSEIIQLFHGAIIGLVKLEEEELNNAIERIKELKQMETVI